MNLRLTVSALISPDQQGCDFLTFCHFSSFLNFVFYKYYAKVYRYLIYIS